MRIQDQQHEPSRSGSLSESQAHQADTAAASGSGISGAVSIFSITEAMFEGQVVEVSTMAHEVGFQGSVVVSARVWSEVVMAASEPGRPCGDGLWGVLYLAHAAIRFDARPLKDHEVRFGVRIADGGSHQLKARTYRLADGTQHTAILLRGEG